MIDFDKIEQLKEKYGINYLNIQCRKAPYRSLNGVGNKPGIYIISINIPESSLMVLKLTDNLNEEEAIDKIKEEVKSYMHVYAITNFVITRDDIIYESVAQ